MGKRIVALVGMALAVLAAPARAQDTDVAPKQAVLEKRVPEWLETHGVPAVAVAYIRDGKTVFTSVHGEQSPGVPATKATLFNVASMTKPVTAELVLRLASEGKLSLDASMAPHYVDPDIKDDPRHEALTPAIALSHRTGFANWRRQTDGVLKIQWAPGSKAGYSGEGYDYVGRFLERKLGEPFEDLMARHVFEPTGMKETSFTWRDGFEGRAAVPRGPEGKEGDPVRREEWTGADDLYTTIDDYAAFLVAVMADEGVSLDIAAQRHKLPIDQFTQGCPWGPEVCPKAGGFAMGWAVFAYEDVRVVTQGGADWGERAVAYFVPERGTGAVILTNGANGSKIIRDVAGVLNAAPTDFQAFLAFQAR